MPYIYRYSHLWLFKRPNEVDPAAASALTKELRGFLLLPAPAAQTHTTLLSSHDDPLAAREGETHTLVHQSAARAVQLFTALLVMRVLVKI